MTKDTYSGSRGFTGSIPAEESSSSWDNAGAAAQGTKASPPTESSATLINQSSQGVSPTNAMSSTQPLATTRADSQDAAVKKQPSTKTAELLTEGDWQEEVEELGFDPIQSSDDDSSPSLFFDRIEDIGPLWSN